MELVKSVNSFEFLNNNNNVNFNLLINKINCNFDIIMNHSSNIMRIKKIVDGLLDINIQSGQSKEFEKTKIVAKECMNALLMIQSHIRFTKNKLDILLNNKYLIDSKKDFYMERIIKVNNSLNDIISDTIVSIQNILLNNID